MRALVIEPEAGNGPALVGERLRQCRFELTDVVLSDERGDALDVDLGAPADYDVIVAMGSIRSVYEASSRPWIGVELDFLRGAHAAGVPVLGICFGAQALASAHGGRVVRSDRPQVGWYPLDGGSLLPDGPWMQWHYDRIEPPAQATVLATDEFCVQAFRIGRSLGVQFHPEITSHHLAGWIGNGGAGELVGLGIDPDVLLADTAAIEADVTVRTYRLVDWFLADVADVADIGEVARSGSGEAVAHQVDEVVVIEGSAGRLVDS
jgi:GMP synthase-like glutamine amidotransferase